MAAMSPSASPGVKIGDVSHATYTRGSSTLSCTTARRGAVIGGVCTDGFGTGFPCFKVPKYFSTIARADALSKSPTMTRLALLGA